MKKIAFLLMMFCAMPALLPAQGADYKVVFDLTSNNTEDHEKVLRWAAAIAKDYPESQVEIVFYGHSLDLVTKKKSVDEKKVAELAMRKNIKFSVCQVAMKKHEVSATDLIPGVETVPDGLYELVLKQRAGYGYIKVTH